MSVHFLPCALNILLNYLLWRCSFWAWMKLPHFAMQCQPAVVVCSWNWEGDVWHLWLWDYALYPTKDSRKSYPTELIGQEQQLITSFKNLSAVTFKNEKRGGGNMLRNRVWGTHSVKRTITGFLPEPIQNKTVWT